jgi:hypothetical protein
VVGLGLGTSVGLLRMWKSMLGLYNVLIICLVTVQLAASQEVFSLLESVTCYYHYRSHDSTFGIPTA